MRYLPVDAIDQAALIIVLLQKFSPHEPVEIGEEDFARVRAAFPNGPGLKTILSQLAGQPVISLEVITSAEGQALDKQWGFT